MSTTPATVTAQVKLATADWELVSTMTVPAGPMAVQDFLPLAQALSNRIVDATEQVLAGQGEMISCKKGCGACCRQLVMISLVEARRIRDLVNELPEPRRAEIRQRYAAARNRLAEAGLLDRLLHPESWTEDEYSALASSYFQQHLACPFLEEESCSIHPDRPITCREYLVTSPPENCARMTTEVIKRVRLPLKVFNAVARLDAPGTEHFLESSVPLVLASEWADAHPDPTSPRPGPELLKEFLGHLAAGDAGMPKGPTANAPSGH